VTGDPPSANNGVPQGVSGTTLDAGSRTTVDGRKKEEIDGLHD
jgi:hypothetical protein